MVELRTVALISHTADIPLLILALDFQMGKMYMQVVSMAVKTGAVLIEIKYFACICKTNVLKKVNSLPPKLKTRHSGKYMLIYNWLEFPSFCKATSHMHQLTTKSLGLFKLRWKTLTNTTKGFSMAPLFIHIWQFITPAPLGSCVCLSCLHQASPERTKDILSDPKQEMG